MNNDDIEKVFYDLHDNIFEVFVLKKDNNIYKRTYKKKENSSEVEETEFLFSEYLLIKTIISDKGYYYYGEVKTDKCTKYQDVKCEWKLQESEIYKKFKKDIKYVGEYYTILSDNSVIPRQSI